MSITRRLVAHDDNDDNQWLKIDHPSRYVAHSGDDWQFLFGPNSLLNNSAQVVKLAARFEDVNMNTIKIVAYLYDTRNAATANAATCSFRLFKIVTPDWTETLEATVAGVQLSNNYFFAEPTVASLSNFDFSGGDTMMIEATLVRSGITYRDRIYVNHLGVYESVLRLRNDIEYLDLTKVDE